MGRYGELGIGTKDYNAHTTFTQVTTNINNDVKQVVSCGSYESAIGYYGFTFILKNDGSLWSCGSDGYGQLGLGATNEGGTATFTKVNISGEVVYVSCGCQNRSEGVTLIIKNDGSLWGTGYNGDGRLGLGDVSYITTFTQVTTNINNDVKQIDCGDGHTFILKNDGSVWSCGYNNLGQLGLGITGSTNKTFTQIPRGL